ncbi:MAG: APC family permease [Rhodocyclaceae bacterium]|nr:APC family permease [Rhodocyclaceae bacterium]MBX3668227.1 APC family permease [Rhodocyclaceae bacterium]
MRQLQALRKRLFGAALDPFNSGTRQHVALMAFLAWVGLGADGLSSACYGPEEAFLALGAHTQLGLYLAIVTAATVFIIALAYNQVIELFPSGGGGYKVATRLISPYAGLVSGAALIVDYVLTIAISVASGMDALFSLLPAQMADMKLTAALAVVALLIFLNLRGMKESIQILLPIFIGFFITHTGLILYGITEHFERVSDVLPNTIAETQSLVQNHGWMFTAALFLRAYSLGGGTYTGLEAVSNNVNMLAEPRVETGRWTMFYMAASLAFMAGGIILLYLMWDATHVPGQTLNAVVFKSIIESFGWDTAFNTTALTTTLAFEAGLLVVAANTGFLGGPSVLANMAVDSWMPQQFRHLSNRLVTQHGVLLMGAAAVLILLWTHGSVAVLVVLYSINVFLTFSLSLFGLCRYWLAHRARSDWMVRLGLSLTGLAVTSGILVVTVVEKFTEGGWATMLITGLVIVLCILIKRHYKDTARRLKRADELFANEPYGSNCTVPLPDKDAPTAVFMIGGSRGGGMHALKWVLQNFPNHFRNFVFVSARAVDIQSFGGDQQLQLMQQESKTNLLYFVNYCHSHGLPAKSLIAFGTDSAEEMMELAGQVCAEFDHCMFFTSKLVFPDENMFTRALHNQTALQMQRRLHLLGMQMVILPMNVD